jgi:fatty acid kinase fatty acid binding subunit
MSQVGVVTDSTNCLPPEVLKEYGIRVGPVVLNIAGKSYRDQVDMTTAEFWEVFPTLEKLPTTSGVNPADFLAHFQELAKTTDSIVCVTLSKGLSVTYDAAVQAREMLRKENSRVTVEIIDSLTCVGAEGLMVLEAARAARAGKNLAEVAQVVKDMIPKVKFIAALDTLKYLIKGGRAPKAAMVANLMHLKPFIGLTNQSGKVESLGVAMGNQKALLRMVDMVKRHADTSKPVHLIVHHAVDEATGERLKEMVTSQVECAEAYVSDITPVIACHTGPMTGLSFYA